MIVCDVCWIIICKTDEYEDNIDKRILFIGENYLCPECYKRYCDVVVKDKLNLGLRRN